MVISRANSALAGAVVLQFISTHIGGRAPAGDDGTPSREIVSEPFAGTVAVEVSNNVDGETTKSCATTFIGFALALVTTTLPNTVQKGLMLLPVLS